MQRSSSKNLPQNLNAPFFAGERKSLGRAIQRPALYFVYRTYKKRLFPKLLESVNILPEDKPKIRDLLRKPWNPYIRRHSALTDKSLFLKEHVLRQHAGWSPRSQMHLKYLHYFGNESSKSILEAYGIIPKDKVQSDVLKSKQCPNCNEPNKPDAKFCAKCRMVLVYDAYSDTLEEQKQKESELKIMKNDLLTIKELLQTVLRGSSTLMNPEQQTALEQALFRSGWLINEENKTKR